MCVQLQVQMQMQNVCARLLSELQLGLYEPLAWPYERTIIPLYTFILGLPIGSANGKHKAAVAAAACISQSVIWSSEFELALKLAPERRQQSQRACIGLGG